MKTTTVVLFVIMLFLLFEKTESGEPFFRQFAKFAVSDSTDSTFQHSCVSRLCDTNRCNFVRLTKHPRAAPLCIMHYALCID